jgi:metallo-beta-lactamase class B
MQVTEGGDRHEVVFVGGASVLPGVRLVDNPEYPGMADDFARTFRLLRSLPCDVFLAPHGFHFDLEEKARRLATGEEPNPFLDPVGYRSFIDRSERVYLDQLRRERQDSAPPRNPDHPAGGS